MHSRFPLLAIGLLLAPALRSAPPPPLSSGVMLDNLNETLRWNREVETGLQWITQPSEEFFWDNERSMADQAVQLAFAAARAELPIVMQGQQAGPAPGSATSANRGKIASLAASRAARIRELQDQVDALNARIAAAPTPDAAAQLKARRDALLALANLYHTMADSLQKFGDMLDASSGDNPMGTLSGQIDALQRSVPTAFGSQPTSVSLPTPAAVDTGGLIRRTLSLFQLLKTLRGLDALAAETARVQSMLSRIQDPVRANLRLIVSQGEQAAASIDTSDTDRLAAAQQRLQGLSAAYTGLMAVSLPVRQESMLLDQCRNNLAQWRDSVHQLYQKTVSDVIVRAGGILAMLALVLVISNVWSRMAFRYVRDERRRRQFLLVRRVVTGILMAGVILLGFISDFSSLATFAGVITAGVAVALQTIILSIAAYFFMIGRSGLRAGDRVTIAGVTGDVMHVGPVRFYVRELTGAGDDFKPTGRVAIFSNAVIFQHNPVFRPIGDEKGIG